MYSKEKLKIESKIVFGQEQRAALEWSLLECVVEYADYATSYEIFSLAFSRFGLSCGFHVEGDASYGKGGPDYAKEESEELCSRLAGNLAEPMDLDKELQGVCHDRPSASIEEDPVNTGGNGGGGLIQYRVNPLEEAKGRRGELGVKSCETVSQAVAVNTVCAFNASDEHETVGRRLGSAELQKLGESHRALIIEDRVTRLKAEREAIRAQLKYERFWGLRAQYNFKKYAAIAVSSMMRAGGSSKVLPTGVKVGVSLSLKAALCGPLKEECCFVDEQQWFSDDVDQDTAESDAFAEQFTETYAERNMPINAFEICIKLLEMVQEKVKANCSGAGLVSDDGDCLLPGDTVQDGVKMLNEVLSEVFPPDESSKPKQSQVMEPATEQVPFLNSQTSTPEEPLYRVVVRWDPSSFFLCEESTPIPEVAAEAEEGGEQPAEDAADKDAASEAPTYEEDELYTVKSDAGTYRKFWKVYITKNPDVDSYQTPEESEEGHVVPEHISCTVGELRKMFQDMSTGCPPILLIDPFDLGTKSGKLALDNMISGNGQGKDAQQETVVVFDSCWGGAGEVGCGRYLTTVNAGASDYLMRTREVYEGGHEISMIDFSRSFCTDGTTSARARVGLLLCHSANTTTVWGFHNLDDAKETATVLSQVLFDKATALQESHPLSSIVKDAEDLVTCSLGRFEEGSANVAAKYFPHVLSISAGSLLDASSLEGDSAEELIEKRRKRIANANMPHLRNSLGRLIGCGIANRAIVKSSADNGSEALPHWRGLGSGKAQKCIATDGHSVCKCLFEYFIKFGAPAPCGHLRKLFCFLRQNFTSLKRPGASVAACFTWPADGHLKPQDYLSQLKNMSGRRPLDDAELIQVFVTLDSDCDGHLEADELDALPVLMGMDRFFLKEKFRIRLVSVFGDIGSAWEAATRYASKVSALLVDADCSAVENCPGAQTGSGRESEDIFTKGASSKLSKKIRFIGESEFVKFIENCVNQSGRSDNFDGAEAGQLFRFLDFNKSGRVDAADFASVSDFAMDQFLDEVRALVRFCVDKFNTETADQSSTYLSLEKAYRVMSSGNANDTRDDRLDASEFLERIVGRLGYVRGMSLHRARELFQLLDFNSGDSVGLAPEWRCLGTLAYDQCKFILRNEVCERLRVLHKNLTQHGQVGAEIWMEIVGKGSFA